MDHDPWHEKVAELYDSMAESYDGIDGDAFYANQYAAYAAHLEPRLAELTGDVLDLGCGTGIQTVTVARVARSVVGVDISPRLLEAARGKTAGLSNVRLIEADAVRLPLESGSFDAVLSYGETLSHIAEHEAAFREAVRVLRPGGIFLFSVLNKWNLGVLRSPAELMKAAGRRGGHLRTWVCQDDHGNPTRMALRTFTPGEVADLGGRLGFQVEAAEGIHVASLTIPLVLQRAHVAPLERAYRALGAVDSRWTRRLAGCGYTTLYATRRKRDGVSG
jgi:ubiquinone/menaquinone biosynthesis C-methylase UbiE